MHNPSAPLGRSPSISLWISVLFIVALSVTAVYWFKTASALRAENHQLRETLATLQQAENSNQHLAETTRELKQAQQFDVYKIEQLEAEVSRLRKLSNDANDRILRSLQKHLDYARLQEENITLKAKAQRLEDELSGKPRPPRIGGWLGVSIAAANKDNNYAKSESGIAIIDVVEGSPADRAALRVQDVVLSIDGEAIADPPTFKSIMAQKEVGKVVMLDVLRTDGVAKIEIKPRDWPQ